MTYAFNDASRCEMQRDDDDGADFKRAQYGNTLLEAFYNTSDACLIHFELL